MSKFVAECPVEGCSFGSESYWENTARGEIIAHLYRKDVSGHGPKDSRPEKDFDTEERDQEIVVTVEDDGRGIPDEDKEKIFDRGFKSSETGSSGLGLYLVKEIVESYGGGVEVKDSELGGAKFNVHLQKA